MLIIDFHLLHFYVGFGECIELQVSFHLLTNFRLLGSFLFCVVSGKVQNIMYIK